MNGFHNDQPVYCPVNCQDENDCPYARMGLCGLETAPDDCDDFAAFFPSWEDWEGAE
jgi:hypothetical protein